MGRLIEDLSGKPKPAGESKLPGSERERRDAKRKEDQRNKAVADSIKAARADSLKGGDKAKKPDPKAEAKAKAKALADSVKTAKAKAEAEKKALADSIKTAKVEAKKKAEETKKKAEARKKAVADSIKTAKAEEKRLAREEKKRIEDEKNRKEGKFVLKKDADGPKSTEKKPLETAQREGQPPAAQEPRLGLRTRMFMAVSRSLSPITFRYSKDSQLSYAGISERPSFRVRFGQGTIAPPDSDTVVSRQNTFAETETMSFDTSMKLPLDMGFSATADLNNRDTQSLSANSRSKEATLPEIDFKWGNLEKRIPYLKRVMNNVQITSRFSIKAAREWLNDDPNPTADRTTRSHSPLVSLNGILFGGLQTSVSYNITSEENLSYSGETSSVTIMDRTGMNGDLRYNMSPSSGILKRFKLKSSIDFSVSFSTTTDQQRRSIEDKEMATVQKNTGWMVSPKADYRFSEKFTGSAMVRVENTKDMTNKVHKVREVSISGRMIF